MTSASPDTLTQAEYLELERKAPVHSEYIDGRMFAMSGASRRHNLITMNLSAALHGQLKDRPCEVYASDMRVKGAATGMYTYPDVVAVRGEPQLEDDLFDTLLNEWVLSDLCDPAATLHLPSIEGVPLDDIYDRVDFADR